MIGKWSCMRRLGSAGTLEGPVRAQCRAAQRSVEVGARRRMQQLSLPLLSPLPSLIPLSQSNAQGARDQDARQVGVWTGALLAADGAGV